VSDRAPPYPIRSDTAYSRSHVQGRTPPDTAAAGVTRCMQGLRLCFSCSEATGGAAGPATSHHRPDPLTRSTSGTSTAVATALRPSYQGNVVESGLESIRVVPIQ